MSAFKTPDFNDRQSAAVKARLAALEKFKAKPGPGHPEFEKKQAERIALEAARKERDEVRRIEKEKRQAEEAIAAAAAEEEKRKQELAAHLALIAEKEDLENAQKAARDARYAARKAAKKARKSG
jgi:response regulator RpfG family c-di-GMP phosphodiesterase